MGKTFLYDWHTSKDDRLHAARRLSRVGRTILFGYLLVLPYVGHAVGHAPGDAWSDLPVLGGQPANGPEYIGINAESIAVGAHGNANTWGAQLDGYQGVRPSLQIEQGWIVNDKLGAGGKYTLGSGYSEVLLNGVYAPVRDLRVQLSAAQMRSKKNFLSASSDESQAVLQTGYLLDIQKKWKSDHVLTEAGVAIYTANASDADAGKLAPRTDANGAQADNGSQGRLATGTLGGYMLNLALQPTQRSDIGLIYKREHVVYHFAGNTLNTSSHSSASISYTQSFRDCSLLDSRFSKGLGQHQVDLRFEKDNWNVSVSRRRSADHSDTSLQVGYSISLGGSDERPTKCDAPPDSSPTFESVIDTTTARPHHLPKEPLARTEMIEMPPQENPSL
jgi:hypothetical protein